MKRPKTSKPDNNDDMFDRMLDKFISEAFPDENTITEDDVEDDVTILLVGNNPDNNMVSKAIMKGIKIVPNSRFSDLCSSRKTI